MRYFHYWQILAILLSCSLFNQTSHARSVYLNGIDISNAHSQDLKKVDLRMDQLGNIFITAPHYQVMEQDQYQPLTRMKEPAAPAHKIPMELPMSTEKKDSLEELTKPQDPKALNTQDQENHPIPAKKADEVEAPNPLATAPAPVPVSIPANPTTQSPPQLEPQSQELIETAPKDDKSK